MRDLAATITFGLAYLGYLSLAVATLAHAAGRPRRWPTVATAVVVLAHVVLVWHVRYQWFPGPVSPGASPRS